MALIHSFEKSGNFLFKHRGQIPIVLFLSAIPIIYFTDNSFLSKTAETIIVIVAVLLSIAGFLIRCYAIGKTPKGTSGRNTDKQVAETLNTSGIYSVVRHPLYLGNYLMWLGIVVFTFNIYFIIIFSLLFWIYYERIMFAEERFLEKKFGDVFFEWSTLIPAFIPSFKRYQKSNIPFSLKSVFRREYSGIAATAIGFAFVDLVRVFFREEAFYWNRLSIYIALASIIIAFFFRMLKHNHLLDEHDRS